jgi:hypothetical protein
MPDRGHFSQFQETSSQFQEKNPISTEIPFAYNIETNKQETIKSRDEVLSHSKNCLFTCDK